MKVTDAQIDEIIEYLHGTCNSLYVAVMYVTDDEYDSDDLTMEQLRKIDDEIFECEQCGWWFDMYEQAECDYQVCNYCHEY